MIAKFKVCLKNRLGKSKPEQSMKQRQIAIQSTDFLSHWEGGNPLGRGLLELHKKVT